MQVPHPNVAETAVVYPGVTIEDDVTIFPGAVIGRPARRPGAAPVHANIYRTVIGAGSIIGCNAVIYEGVSLGRTVLIGDGATIRERCVIGDNSIVGNNCTFQNDVHMGKNSRVIDLSHITADVHIGDNVFISTGVLTMNDNSMNKGGSLAPPFICDGAMIGGGAILLPGVDIGTEAIVAAGAVVTKNVEHETRVQGVPARPYAAGSASTPDEIWEEYFFDDN